MTVADQVFIKQATLPTPLTSHDCVENSLTHKIYCFGGYTGSTTTNQIIEYDSINDNISIMNTQLLSPRSGLNCAEDSSTHKIYCFGGNTQEITEYDSSLNRLILKNAQLPTSRSEMGCAEDSSTHKIYCIGGSSGSGPLSDILEYNPQTDTLQRMSAPFPGGRRALACAEYSNTHKIYCFGGEFQNSVLEYDPGRDLLVIKNAVLPTARRFVDCASVPSTKNIYCFGGDDVTRVTLKQIVAYSPDNDTLTIKSAELPSGRFAFGCAANSNTHRFYCFGGTLVATSLYTNQIVEYSDKLPPILIPIGNRTFIENETSIIQLEATDPDNDTLTFATDAALVLPSPFYFNETTGYFAWTPTFYDEGNYSVTFSVSDDENTVSERINIEVVDTPYINLVLNNIPILGDTLNFSLIDTAHPGASYFLLFSIADTPGINLSDGRVIPLYPDGIFYASLYYPLLIGLYGSQSRLDQFGNGEAFWNIPPIRELAGFELSTAFVTIDLRAPLPGAILSISSAKRIKILPRNFTVDSNTVALWHFNEGSGNITQDASSNGNDGVLKNNVTWITGIDGNALRFNGVDNYVEVPDSSSLQITDAFTLEAWIQVEDILSDSTVDTLIGKDHQYAFGIGDTLFPRNIAFGFENQTPNICDPTGWCDGNGPVPFNEWHHVAVQYDGQTMKTFLDGQLQNQYSAQFTIPGAPTPLAIGARIIFLPESGPTAFFKGTIDEVRISNIARY